MNDRPVLVRLKEVLGPGLRYVGAKPPQHLPKSNPRRRLELGHFTAEGAHPRRIKVCRPLTERTIGSLAAPSEQPRAVHPGPVALQVSQPREHVRDRSVDRRARLVPHGATSRLLHRKTSTFSCDIAYSTSPAASSASLSSWKSRKRTILPSRKVSSSCVCDRTSAPLIAPLPTSRP